MFILTTVSEILLFTNLPPNFTDLAIDIGAATIGWALIASFILLDFPATSKRLSDRERYIAINRLIGGGVTVRSEDGLTNSKTKSFWLALRDWRTWGFIFGYMGTFLACIAFFNAGKIC